MYFKILNVYKIDLEFTSKIKNAEQKWYILNLYIIVMYNFFNKAQDLQNKI